ncbi:MAG: oligosaccharide flippase family protein [Ruthenibacterium sp.]
MRKTGYVKSAAILTGTGLVLRAAGMVLRVYVAGQLGAGGMGVYQLIFTVYNLSVTLATAGLSVTATRLCAQCRARGRPGAVRPVMRRMLALALALGLLCGLAQFALARPAAQWWLKDLRAVPALRLLAPSLPFMALSAVLRGYFLAVRRVRPNALAQLFEQAVRISVVVLLLARAVPHGLAAACAAAVVGNTVSEAASWCYMMACWGGPGALWAHRKSRTCRRGPLCRGLRPLRPTNTSPAFCARWKT